MRFVLTIVVVCNVGHLAEANVYVSASEVWYRNK